MPTTETNSIKENPPKPCQSQPRSVDFPSHTCCKTLCLYVHMPSKPLRIHLPLQQSLLPNRTPYPPPYSPPGLHHLLRMPSLLSLLSASSLNPVQSIQSLRSNTYLYPLTPGGHALHSKSAQPYSSHSHPYSTNDHESKPHPVLCSSPTGPGAIEETLTVHVRNLSSSLRRASIAGDTGGQV
jgi:hypothetical protein